MSDVALKLFHGRKSLTERMDGWGTQGPVFLVSYVHTTYKADIKLGIECPKGDGDLKIVDDLVYYDGVYYGDWSVFPAELAQSDAELVSRIAPFDHDKATPPNPNTPPDYVGRALALLREARSLLRLAGSKRALIRVRLAISSTEGALRHAFHWHYRNH